jgi:hypothetical protein
MTTLVRSRTALCRNLLVMNLIASLCACAGEKADVLAQKLQSAIEQSNIDGALALGDFAHAPPEVVSTYIGILENCAHQSHCQVTLGEFDQTSSLKPGQQFAQAPIGTLNIAMTWRKDNSDGGKASLPFALVGGTHQIVYASYSPFELENLRAKSTQQLLDNALQDGIADLSLSAKRTDWKTGANPLPAGGGDIGKRFRTRAQAMYKAAHAGDLAALLSNYYAFDASGNPLPAQVMALKLRGNLPSYPSQVSVIGGYERSDDDGQQVLLLIEASLPNGWVQRGPVLINLYPDSNGQMWRVFNLTIEHPR